MRKEAYYFSHDSNAKDDPKSSLLIEELGLEGYGIYWVLIEILRDQPNYSYPLRMIPIVARKYNTTTPKVETVIRNYGLFIINEDAFFSFSLNLRMEQKEAKSLKAKESVTARWNKKYENDTNVLQMLSEGNTIKEIKEKEIKEKESKNKISISERKINFRFTLEPFLQTYGKEVLNAFFLYWTEPNPTNTKMRFEMQKTWSVSLRLSQWSNRDKTFKIPTQTDKPVFVPNTKKQFHE